jgi:cobalt-zinc-cadmium efflux system protein
VTAGPDHEHDHHARAHGGLGHAHAPANFDRAFAIGTALNFGFVLAELGFVVSRAASASGT